MLVLKSLHAKFEFFYQSFKNACPEIVIREPGDSLGTLFRKAVRLIIHRLREGKDPLQREVYVGNELVELMNESGDELEETMT